MMNLFELPQDARRRAKQVFAGTRSASGTEMLPAALLEVTCETTGIEMKTRCLGD